MKNILICNGSPMGHEAFDSRIGALADTLTAQGNTVKTIALRDKNLHDCIGCYACWLKTPGICALHDGQEEVLRGYVWADFIVVASPLVMGFVSALTKTMTDRLIPLVHPYLRMNGDRMSHYPRYDKAYPSCILLDKEPDGETRQILQDIFKNAVSIKHLDENTEVIAHEIDCI